MTHKLRYKKKALVFLTDPGQADCKLGDILEALSQEGGEHFVLAIKELSVTEIVNAALINNATWSHANDEFVEAALNKDIVKWSKKIEEIKENQAITHICSDAKIKNNSYEEIKLSVLEIKGDMEQSKDFSKYLKINHRNEALEFIGDDEQAKCKLGVILSELINVDALNYANAIEDLTINEITEAVVSQNIDKWSKRVLELRGNSTIDEIIEAALTKDIAKWSKKLEEIKENQDITRICPNAKILTNSYEEIRLSLSEITDSQIHELTKMFGEYSIKITVGSSLLSVRIIRDIQSL
jgi:hypothetical protein